MAEFIIIAVVLIFVTLAADFLLRKTYISGIDFLFYGPWALALTDAAGAVLLALLLTFLHAAAHSRIAHFIIYSFPAQLIAIFMAIFFGAGFFWTALLSYLVASTFIAFFAGGFGGRFSIFLIISFIFNALLFSVGLFL